MTVHYTNMTHFVKGAGCERENLTWPQSIAKLIAMCAADNTRVWGPNPMCVYRRGEEIAVFHFQGDSRFCDTSFYQTYRMLYALLHSHHDHQPAAQSCGDLAEQYFGPTRLQLPAVQIASNHEAAAYAVGFLLGYDTLPQLPSDGTQIEAFVAAGLENRSAVL